jgi:two-component system NtrC family response regulator
MHYTWPGNVRELEDVLKQALKSLEGDAISSDLLPAEIQSVSMPADGAAGSGDAAGGPTDEYRGKSLKAFLRNREKEYLDQVLEHTGGDKGAAAKALKISLATLYRKLPGDSGEETPESQN